MIRSIIPLMVTVLFFMEPVFSLFSPITYADALLTLVPRFVIVCLIFISIYGSRKHAIIYGIIFGLLYDIFYIDIIGIYAFLYPLICLIASGIIRYIHRHIVTVIGLTLLLIALLEIFSYGFASLISVTSIGFEEFFKGRLIPTMLANSLFVIMFSWFFKRIIEEKILHKSSDVM
ncbi:rod shape-determining protein MreD [Sporosarcina pasteurii]|uniref:Rod shape-determining protein MreD n=1 Tax=Sporosarcina pasteurii TaxID=1474 RepID=A0A380BVV8_SPOPA|nr:rod shape-determining protein MreD [Sporosarcina pasteurii]MDS9471325.1 rod shape-determining protein MreD [Sporosarcina pasteurii]QBQ05047.1 rod shape-determining protein MreD [Sporosarcina pasteurii]SUJ07651.1 rod shape-determining protein MreD [Sporosarcina pasteurii]